MCKEKHQIVPKMHSFASHSKGELCNWIAIHKQLPYPPFGREVIPCTLRWSFIFIRKWFLLSWSINLKLFLLLTNLLFRCIFLLYLSWILYNIMYNVITLLRYSCGKSENGGKKKKWKISSFILFKTKTPNFTRNELIIHLKCTQLFNCFYNIKHLLPLWQDTFNKTNIKLKTILME